MRVKFEVHTFNHIGAVSICAQKFRGHASLLENFVRVMSGPSLGTYLSNLKSVMELGRKKQQLGL